MRVLDQVISLLTFIRQSSDYTEARFAMDLEEEMAKRRDLVIEGLCSKAA